MLKEKSDRSTKRLVLIELNEINFELASRYFATHRLRNFQALMAGPKVRTSSEASYEMLEPWIQWVSVHSGQTAAEHGVFRLGDIVGTRIPQIFEKVESEGYSVGCISPMNAENRLRSPAYFIPDPWTATSTDGSPWSRRIGAAISQAVNDNSQGKITAGSALGLLGGWLRFAKPSHYRRYVDLMRRSKGAPWRKALFLDLFIHDLHYALLRRRAPNFSTLFLNAGAHIQHHYLFNSKAQEGDCRNPAWYLHPQEDPVLEMLQVYDLILGEYMRMPGVSLLIATGLTQRPYDKITFYYRLKEHEAFLSRVGIAFEKVLPRMTRDFLVEFATEAKCIEAERRMRSFKAGQDGIELFGEIDNRGRSLYVTLTYPHEIGPRFDVAYDGGEIDFGPLVAFVAVKNGMHDPDGFAFFHGGMAQFLPADGAHVRCLYNSILNYFDIAVAN